MNNLNKKNHLKILKHFLELRPEEIAGNKISKLKSDQKYELAKEIRVWGYLDALSREIAKDLSLDLDDITSLLGGATLIHMSIFDYDKKTTNKIYNEMFKQLNEHKIWKKSFVMAAEDAQKDMLDFRNNVKIIEASTFPRFDMFIWVYIEKFNV